MALTDKLIAIGDAIRSKTYVLRGLSLTEMAEKINVDWIPPGEQKIKDYVKDFYIQDDIVGCCEYLYKESSRRWIKEEEDTIDDITIIVVFFEK